MNMKSLVMFCYLDKLNIHFRHGRNLVGDTGDVTPTFSVGGDIICHVPPLFLFKFCTWRSSKNKSDVCHVLCEVLFMLDVTQPS